MEKNFQIEILKKSNTQELIVPEELKDIILKIKNLSENIFNDLGTGFSEIIYHRALETDLRNSQIIYESKKIIPIEYKGINVGYGEADIVIHHESKIIVIELKAVTNPPREIEIAQVKTYLRNIKNSTIGMIINFPQPGTKIAKETIDFKIVKK
jgi:GxxExxY protein